MNDPHPIKPTLSRAITTDNQSSTSVNLKKSFIVWMKKNGDSEKTITNYSQTAINLIDKLIKEAPLNAPNIYSITSSYKLDQLIEKLEKTSEWKEKNEIGKGMYQASLRKYRQFLNSPTDLPKPFLLLAGISGTGKSRFVQEQARLERPDLSNYLNIPVRPDWHEPSDLLGYVSQINGKRYIATDFLTFIVAAWRAAISFADATRFELKPLNEIHTFWCCLDEMNLAPVEQYFADYLSVSENRQWQDGQYICSARNTLIQSGLLQRLKNNAELRTQLGFLSADEGLWQYFLANGIPLPPNLIVAGTVNMDETTHGFSRKVIDRAFTIDFGKFFPNVLDDFFAPKTINKALSFPTLSSATLEDLAAIEIDADGQKTISFIKAINQRLADTPFELAYRALNELLLAVICFAPKSEAELQAVWDDFLMSKLLPRIDGDRDKLKPLDTNSDYDTTIKKEPSLLTELQAILATQMPLIWNTQRIDLLRSTTDGKEIPIKCRSNGKLEWMHDRLVANSFTSFWP